MANDRRPICGSSQAITISIATRQVADPDDSDSVATAELIEAVESLGGKNREVVSLHYFLGMSVREIATAVDTSTGAVKLRLHRARIELRNRLSSPAAAWRRRRDACLAGVVESRSAPLNP